MASPITFYTAQTCVLAEDITESSTNTTISASVTDSTLFPTASGVAKVGTGTSSEWFSYTGITTVSSTKITFTGVNRGLDRDATSYSDVTSGNKKSNSIGAPIKIVRHSVDINKSLQKDADETITGTIGFNNTTKPGFVAPNYTTAQRDALTGVTNGAVIYNTTTGITQVYEGGAWNDKDTGSGTPNASETVAGKVEIATTAERQAMDATGGTGAILMIPNDDTIRTIHPDNENSAGNFELNKNGTGNRTSEFAMHSDDTYTDGSVNLSRASGVDGNTTFLHRGGGIFSIKANDNDGVIGFDNSDTGVGIIHTAGETITKGQALYLKASDGKAWKALSGGTREQSEVLGIALNDAVADGMVVVQKTGWCKAFGGQTPGNKLYLSTTAGAVTSTVPTMNSGSVYPVLIGYITTASTVNLTIKRLPRRIVGQTSQIGTSTATLTITAGFPISHMKLNYFNFYKPGGSGVNQRNEGNGFYDVVAASQNVQGFYIDDASTNSTAWPTFVVPTGKCIYAVDVTDSSGTRQGAASVNGSNNIEIAWTDSGYASNADNTLYIQYEIHELL